ncbi:MAG: hypothetical protein WC675_02420 [Patescibacteria group bacterium]|jgi:hypothetical protein
MDKPKHSSHHRHTPKPTSPQKGKVVKENVVKQWLWFLLWCSWFGHNIKGCEACPRCGQYPWSPK